MNLADELHALAEQAPVTSMPPDLFNRARRRHRWRLVAAVAAMFLIVLGGYAVTLPDLHPLPAAAGPAGIPLTVADPPLWTDEIQESPPGPAALVFRGPAVPARSPFRAYATPTAVVGLTRDVYRVVYPSQSTTALSPDGRTLLLPQLNSPTDLRAAHWRTDALDLVTGRSRRLATGFAPIGWSVDGKHALLVQPNRWNDPDASAATVNDMIVSVVAWPSGQTEWSVHVARPSAVEGEGNYPVALSPDGASLAVSTSQELRVYGRDGAIRWKRPLTGQDVLAGPAAWRDDGRIALARRPGVANSFDTGDATLTFVDARTGDESPGPHLPTVRKVFSLQVVAWRGDTAYAVARTQPAPMSEDIHASLIRLTPGASSPQTMLAPAGVEDLNVATDYVDRMRTAGSPSYGLSLTGLTAAALPAAGPAVVAAALVVLIWWLRRRRIERSAMPMP
jgi:hypothetical protein